MTPAGQTALDFSSSAIGQGNVAMLAAWVTANVMTQAQHDQLLAMAAVPASRVQVLGIGPVTGVDVRSTVFNSTGVKVI